MNEAKRIIEDILTEMKQHTELNPSHGFNCSCKDSHTREIQRIIKDLGVKREFHLIAIYVMNSQ